MKSHYKLFFVISTWAFATNAFAQDQAPESFTLQQCIDYALENAVSARNAALDQKAASERVKEVTGIGLPQVSASSNITHNIQLQRFFGLYATAQGFAGTHKETDPNNPNAQIDVPNINLAGVAPTDVVAMQSFFQLKSSATASLSASQMIFNGSYFVGLKASKTYRELSEKTANQTKEVIIQQITKAYYNVLINKERLALFTNNIARVDSLLRNTIALHQNGFAESIDVDRIRVTFNNIKSEQEKFSRLNELSVELLKFQMNYPMEKSIAASGNIEDVQIETSTANYEKDWDYKVRPDYKVLETNKRLQELNIRNAYSGSLPTITAIGNYGYNTQSADVAGLFKTNTHLNEQTINGVAIGPDKWYSYSSYGINFNMPLFTGLQRHHQIQQQKLTLMKIENNFNLLKQNINLEVKQSSTNFENAITSLSSQKENMDLANKVAKVTKTKYEQGIGSNLEVVDAENSLRQAQTNYYSALFDAMVAKVDLDKAYGKLLPTYSK